MLLLSLIFIILFLLGDETAVQSSLAETASEFYADPFPDEKK
jgi:hypothetical protein